MEGKHIFKKTAVMMLAALFVFAAAFASVQMPSYAASKPAKVTGIRAAARSNYSVRISWKKVKNAKKYQVYRANKKNGRYKKITTLTGTSYINSDLKKGTRYFYRVRAVNGNSKGAFSAKKSVSTMNSPLYDVEIDKGAGTVTISAKVNGKYFSRSTRHLMVDQYGFNKGTAMLTSYCIPDDLYNGLVRAGGVSWSKSAGKKLKNGEKNTVPYDSKGRQQRSEDQHDIRRQPGSGSKNSFGMHGVHGQLLHRNGSQQRVRNVRDRQV